MEEKSADSRRLRADGQEKEWCSHFQKKTKNDFLFSLPLKKKSSKFTKICRCHLSLTVMRMLFDDMKKTSPQILHNVGENVVFN